jgi:hypothetical protein
MVPAPFLLAFEALNRSLPQSGRISSDVLPVLAIRVAFIARHGNIVRIVHILDIIQPIGVILDFVIVSIAAAQIGQNVGLDGIGGWATAFGFQYLGALTLVIAFVGELVFRACAGLHMLAIVDHRRSPD